MAIEALSKSELSYLKVDVVIGGNNKILICVIKNKKLSVDKLISEVSKEININHRSIQIKIVSYFPRLANGKIDYKVMQKKII